MSTSIPLRALVYAKNGSPSEVLRAMTFRPLPQPSPGQVRVKLLLSPVNPADLNVIEGVYPDRPTARADLVPNGQTSALSTEHLFIGGSEAVGILTDLGDGTNSELKPGDRVILDKSQLGAWATYQNVDAAHLYKVDESISDVAAATMKVNPPTALLMLRSFVNLSPGDWVVQNGANSAVGKAVIQIAAANGLKTLNLVRSRPDVDALKQELTSLGATRVLTYEELADKSMKEQVKSWTGGKPILLGLNCVGGRETTVMTGYLGHNAHLVSYGAMSKQPLSLPTSFFIFKNLTSHGYWQSRWYKESSQAERVTMLQEIENLLRSKKLQEPKHNVIDLGGSDEDINRQLSGVFHGGSGGKILLRWDRS